MAALTVVKVNMKNILLIILFSALNSYAQTDWQKWDVQKVSYELPAIQRHDYSIDKTNFGTKILSVARNAYYFFISDLDGDNCPFAPTCSAFFIQSVKEANLIKGTLMFADRFTRDINFFKGMNHYRLNSSGKFFDPAYNYTFDSQKIKF